MEKIYWSLRGNSLVHETSEESSKVLAAYGRVSKNTLNRLFVDEILPTNLARLGDLLHTRLSRQAAD